MWVQMPQQQHMRVDGHAGAGQGGRGSYGGGGGTGAGEGGRDRQDVARETRERETGSIFGGGGERGQRGRGQRQAQLDRMMSAQHRSRATRGAIDPTTGLSALTGQEMEAEQGWQGERQDMREMAIGAIGSVIGALFGVPGLGAGAKAMAARGREDRIGAAMESYEETGVLSGPMARGGPPGITGEGEVAANRQDKPKPPDEATPDPTTPPPLRDPFDDWWMQNFGINPNDPRITDPSFDPSRPNASPAAMRRLDMQTSRGNPTLGYMARVNADIQRSRERQRLAGPQ